MAFKYQQLAQQIVTEIHSDKLKAGDPLPALRKFAHQHQVSLTTANQAYEWLQRQGLIVAKAQSGFYVKGQPNSLPLSAPTPKSISIHHDPSDVIFDIMQNALTYDRIGLSNGFLDESLRPSLALQRSIKRTAKLANITANSYGHTQGEVKLRNAVAELMRSRFCLVDADNLLITNGCLEAVNLVVEHISQVGETVAILTPCYSGLLTALQYANRKIMEIPCDSQGPDMQHLAELFARRAFTTLIISATATNPLGFNLSHQDKKQLAALAKQHQIYIIEDDTFGSLAYHTQETGPAYAYQHDGFIIYCSSFSKDLTPGMRIGWIASDRLIPALMRRKVSMNITCSIPCQLAMADYLLSESYPAHLRKLRSTLQIQVMKLQACILENFPAGTRVSTPQGGFFIWVELPDSLLAMDIYRQSVQQGICFMPGHTFSMSGQYDHCLRLSVTKTWSHHLAHAVEQLGQIAEQLMQKQTACKTIVESN